MTDTQPSLVQDIAGQVADGRWEALINGTLFRSIRGVQSKIELVGTPNALLSLSRCVQGCSKLPLPHAEHSYFLPPCPVPRGTPHPASLADKRRMQMRRAHACSAQCEHGVTCLPRSDVFGRFFLSSASLRHQHWPQLLVPHPMYISIVERLMTVIISDLVFLLWQVDK
jgi:hypothetical protein